MLNPNAHAAADGAIAPLLVFPSLYQRPPSTAQIRQCRQLFYWGFLLLPCLWLLNWLRYRRLAKEARDDDDGVTEIRMYVRWSLVGCIFTAALLLLWLCVFWWYHDIAQWAYDLQMVDTLDNFLTQHTYA